MFGILSGIRFLQQFGSLEAAAFATKALKDFRATKTREKETPEDHFIYNTGNATLELLRLEQRQDRPARNLHGVQW